MAVVSRIYELVSLLDRYDPIELIKGGAPLGEYMPEARTILEHLQEMSSADETVALVHREFVSWFDAQIAGSLDNYREVGSAIWEWWVQQGRHGQSDA